MHEPDVPPPPAGNSCRRIEADFLTTADGRVCIFFPFKGMSKRIARTFFGSGFFEIREAFTLPDHVMAKFPQEASPVIPVGYYPVVVSKTGYSVIF